MTTATYEPLRALPQLEQKARFAWLIGAGIAARKTLDRALSVPRRALGYVLRAGAAALARVTPRPVMKALSWLAGKAAAAVPVLRGVGPVTSAVVALTMPPVQRLVTRALGRLGRLVGCALRATWRAVDASLRLFGDSGAVLADRLSEMGTTLVARVRSVSANPQVQIVAGAGVSVLQLVRPLARELAVHRLVRLLVPQWWCQWLLEAVVAPFLVDGHLAHVVRIRVQSGLARLATPPAVPVATAATTPVVAPSLRNVPAARRSRATVPARMGTVDPDHHQGTREERVDDGHPRR